jgi:hypothetical protein
LKRTLIIITLILSFSNLFGQTNDRIYLSKSHSYGKYYCYSVQELIIHSDSTYTRKSYCTSKKEWRKYKTLEPITQNGKITRNGNLYTLTAHKDGIETEYNWTLELKNEKAKLFFTDKKGKRKLLTKYKQIGIE